MAKRGRHPGRKSQTRSHNQNPKLSPFQREQKRNKLANQAPTALTESNAGRQYSRSQRDVFKYFERREAIEADRLTRAAPRPPLETAVVGKARMRKMLSRKMSDSSPGAIPQASKKALKTHLEDGVAANAKSLNSQLLDGASTFHSRIVQDTTLATIMRKKTKKHEKKKLVRKQKLHELLQQGDARVREEMTREKAGKKGRKRQRDLLIEQQQQRGEENSQSGLNDFSSGNGPTDAGTLTAPVGTAKKDRDARPKGAEGGGKPREFYELVDIVKFGERVEAPPVLSVLPDTKSKISLLGVKLLEGEEAAKKKRRGESAGASTRHALLGGSTSLAEQKRLMKLGLQENRPVPADVSTASATALPTTKSTTDEFALLREKVMETYRRNKAAHRLITSHVFPVLS
jgi:hypothetical protein